MKQEAWASLCITNTDNSTYYRIRFNRLAGKLLDGTRYVVLSKTVDGNYLVISPIDHAENGSLTVTRDPYGFCWLHITSLVTGGNLPKRLFRKRYKVKRDKAGRIYVCLKEVVKGDD